MLLRPARPLCLSVPLPHPPECGRARSPGGLSRARAGVRAPAPPHAPSSGRALRRERESLLPPAPPRPGARRRREVIVEVGPTVLPLDWGRRCGSRRAQCGSGGVLSLRSALSSAPAGDFTLPRLPSPTRSNGARHRPRVHARLAGGRRAFGRVRGVRWRWGRREPELSQAPGPPDQAKWGVMAAGGSGCTSSAGGGGGGGRGVNPRRSGRCVCICVPCVRGEEEGEGGTGSDREEKSLLSPPGGFAGAAA